MFVKKYYLYIVFFLGLSLVGFLTLGLPSLTGAIDLQTYSDSLTYERLSKNLPSGISLISVSANLIGPITLLRIFDYSYPLIFAFNLLILVVSLGLIFRYYDLNKNVFLFFMFVSPLMFFSMFNVNKETLLILNMALFLSFLKNRKLLFIVLAIALSLLIRWQMTAFILLALSLLFVDRYFGARKTIVMGLIVGISIVYPMLAGVFEAVISHSLPDNDAVRGSGIFQRMNQIQNTTGGYVIAFLPKLLLINFGIIKRFHMITELSLFWSYFVLMLHSVASLLLTIYVIFKKRFTFNNKLIYLAIVYGSIFAVSPIINVRYFLPMYILFAVVASSRITELNISHGFAYWYRTPPNLGYAGNRTDSGKLDPDMRLS